jgi:class 3 adenylate cyclase
MSELAQSPGIASADLLREGRAASARHAWQEAFELLSSADATGTLSGRDLEALAEAAFFSARPDAEAEIKERAFKAHQAASDNERAAYMALDLANTHSYRGRHAIAAAWTRRAERLLEGMEEGYAHGYLALVRSDRARAAGDIDVALAEAEEAVRIAGRTGDNDLAATALIEHGTLKIATGATSEGLALMEEASIKAITGELSPFTTGVACCRTISAYRDLADYARASEWTEETDRWCHQQSVAGFPGICRVHRAEVVAVGGAWDRAEHELRQAADELAAYRAVPPMADAMYAIGDIRRLKGDLAGADQALREAHALGRSPQPALALVRLAEGNIKAAANAIDSAVRDETWDQWARVRLLPVQAEIAITSGDVAGARRAVDELEQITAPYSSPAVAGSRQLTLGRVLLAEGDADRAAREIRGAIRTWREVGAPYEVARARVVLGRALLALGDEDGGVLELEAARGEFERLGASGDLAEAGRELASLAKRQSEPIQTRKTFMFTDIVGSTALAELLGNEQWEVLLRWHDDMLRRLVRESGGEVVSWTGDGFFVAFDSAPQALESAIRIQQALAAHRRTTGFALSVRIGLHAAEANRRGDDYSGKGVHVAARVAAIAAGGEVLTTVETLAEAGARAASEPHEVSLKGVSAPVSVVTAAWDAI